MEAVWSVTWNFPMHVAPYRSAEKGEFVGWRMLEIEVDRDTLVKISLVSRERWYAAKSAHTVFCRRTCQAGLLRAQVLLWIPALPAACLGPPADPTCARCSSSQQQRLRLRLRLQATLRPLRLQLCHGLRAGLGGSHLGPPL